MSDQEIRWPEYIAPISYELCDALFPLFCAESELTATRTARTSGSCTYAIRHATNALGYLDLRTAFTETDAACVHCTLVANRKGDPRTHGSRDFLVYFFGLFWRYCEENRIKDARVWRADRITLDDGRTMAQAVADAYGTKVRAVEPKEPEDGDPVAVWLDWRAWRRRQRQRITLEQLAAESGHSLSTLKKASAERKPKRTK